MSRLFDYPSAFGIIAARGAGLVLVGCHNGVMTSRDGVSPDSTRTRRCTMIAAVGACTLQSLWIMRGSVRGHTCWEWAEDATPAPHGSLIVFGNSGKTLARRAAVWAGREDNIKGWNTRG